jgi:hypothetical protein
MNNELEMARAFYGYGLWDALYWFIGPEPGKGPKEFTNACLAETWMKLGACDLCDCKEFHLAVGETCWHREEPQWPKLQSTWRSLILLLIAFLEEPIDIDARRKYQRDRWGRDSGETCVIELSGLAAKGYEDSIDRKGFRQERVETICKKLHEHKPRFVVMYGLSEKEYWEQIAGIELLPDRIVKRDGICFVMTPHPNTRGRTNAEWKKLGKALRGICGAV